MKQKINDFFYYIPLWLLLLLVAFTVVMFIALPSKTYYEARCITGNYQVYRKENSYYLQESDKKFLPYDNCVFVEIKK